MSQPSPAATPSPIPPIWVLNLARSPDRRERIANHLLGLGLKFEFIEAIDGRTMSPEECARVYRGEKFHRLRGRHLLPVQIACSLSHRKAYQRQVDEGHEAVIIFEDDARPDREFLEILDLLDQLPPDWELVHFYRGRDTRTSFWGKRRLGRWLCLKYGSIAWGTVAYMVRQSGARKLLAHSHPVEVPADFLTGGAVQIGLNLYVIYPQCVYEFCRDPTASTMFEAREIAIKTSAKHKRNWFTARLEREYYKALYTFQRFNPFLIK